MFSHGLRNELCLGYEPEPRQPHEQDSRHLPMPQEHELAEPLVSRNQNTVATHGRLENFVISQPRVHLGDVVDLVTVASEGFHDRSVDALVSYENHAASPPTG